MPSRWHRGSRRWRPKTTSPRPSGSPAASPSTPNGRNGLWRTLLKNHQRYYDPCIGRYLSPDPLGLAPNPTRTPTFSTPPPGQTFQAWAMRSSTTAGGGRGRKRRPEESTERTRSTVRTGRNLTPRDSQGRDKGTHFRQARP